MDRSRQINRQRLEQIERIDNDDDRDVALRQLAAGIEDRRDARRVIARITDRRMRDRSYRQLAARIQEWRDAQQVIEEIRDRRAYDQALSQFSERVPEWRDAERIIDRIRDDRTRFHALRQLANRIQNISQAYRVIDRIRSTRIHRLALDQLTDRISRIQRRRRHDETMMERTRRMFRALSLMQGGQAAPAQQTSASRPGAEPSTEIESLLQRLRELGGDNAINQLRDSYPDMFDSITLDIMRNPVQIGTGRSHDAPSVKEWFKTKKEDPVSKLAAHEPIINTTMRGVIASILKEKIQRLQKKTQTPRQKALQQEETKIDPPQRVRQQFIRQYRQLVPNASPAQLVRFQGFDLQTMRRTVGRLTNLRNK